MEIFKDQEAYKGKPSKNFFGTLKSANNDIIKLIGINQDNTVIQWELEKADDNENIDKPTPEIFELIKSLEAVNLHIVYVEGDTSIPCVRSVMMKFTLPNGEKITKTVDI